MRAIAAWLTVGCFMLGATLQAEEPKAEPKPAPKPAPKGRPPAKSWSDPERAA